MVVIATLSFICLLGWRTATLEVGPGRTYSRVEAALQAAVPGDTIRIWPSEDGAAYAKTALRITKPNLTFIGMGGRPKLDGNGFEYSGVGSTPRAIIQVELSGSGCRIENLELSGAVNQSRNGAGIRINEANGVVVSNCWIHDCEMGVMSNGSLAKGTGKSQLLRDCRIYANGSKAETGYSHNLYLGGTDVTLEGCEVFGSTAGHNVKSRAHRTVLNGCYIHDSANREVDWVDDVENTAAPESDGWIAGCVIVKDPKCSGNRVVIHFGQDGGHPRNGTLYLLNNTICSPFISPIAQISSSSATALSAWNNIVIGEPKGQCRFWELVAGLRSNADGDGNWGPPGLAGIDGVPFKLSPSLALPGFGHGGQLAALKATYAGVDWNNATASAMQRAGIGQIRFPCLGGGSKVRPTSSSVFAGAVPYF